MSKYLPLSEWLSRQTHDERRLGLAEIEAMLGSPLPRTARHANWWIGEAEKPQHRAWLDRGWRVQDFDQAAGTVTFHRIRAPRGVQPPVMKDASEEAARRAHFQTNLGAAALVGAGLALAAGLGVLAGKALGRRGA